MEKLEVIRIVHVVDHHLGQLASILSNESFKKRVLTIGGEWRELAHALTAQLCGVEPGIVKKGVRKKASPASSATVSEDERAKDGEENCPSSSPLLVTPTETE